MKWSALSETQREKRGRKEELLALVESLVPTGRLDEAEPDDGEEGEPEEDPRDTVQSVPVADDDDEDASGTRFVPKIQAKPKVQMMQKKKKTAKKDVPEKEDAAPLVKPLVKPEEPWWWIYLPKGTIKWCRNRRDSALAGKGKTGKYD